MLRSGGIRQSKELSETRLCRPVAQGFVPVVSRSQRASPTSTSQRAALPSPAVLAAACPAASASLRAPRVGSGVMSLADKLHGNLWPLLALSLEARRSRCG